MQASQAGAGRRGLVGGVLELEVKVGEWMEQVLISVAASVI